MPKQILRMAVPSPLRRLFDYLPLEHSDLRNAIGCRFRVPFGRGERIGLLVDVVDHSAVQLSRLKSVTARLDAEPILPERLMQLLLWVSHYYHYPLGAVFETALPVNLRQGAAVESSEEPIWSVTHVGRAVSPDELRRAPKQREIFELICASDAGIKASVIKEMGLPIALLHKLALRGWIVSKQVPPQPWHLSSPVIGMQLVAEQQQAVDRGIHAIGSFTPVLLHGVTGSGKTEVYLQICAELLKKGQSALIIVPEIGLTPQLVQRFRQRLPVPIELFHSRLSNKEREAAWSRVSQGAVAIVIGTRSAVFAPFRSLGLIIVDEEHDSSLKQMDGLRYSARDVAIKRAQLERCPVILGSATPTLETLLHAQQGDYAHWQLTQRVGGAIPPVIQLLDVRHHRLQDGLSQPLLKLVEVHLQQQGQVLLFLNRRGYAPTQICYECGWVARCDRCDMPMALYAGQRRIRCNHCERDQIAATTCPQCHCRELHPVGEGTERIEEAVTRRFPDVEVVRIDSDTTRRKGSLEQVLARIEHGKRQILIGTQLLAKGHHFPNVTLVGVINADQGLFSVDYRAPERMVQQILQVAGRAGRAERVGTVVIQTHAPEHPIMRHLIKGDYVGFATEALHERQIGNLPPYHYLALLRAEAPHALYPIEFLQQAKTLAEGLMINDVELWGPVPAPMELRAGRHRAQLLIQSHDRRALHTLLGGLMPLIERDRSARRVRWSLDIDPIEMY